MTTNLITPRQRPNLSEDPHTTSRFVVLASSEEVVSWPLDHQFIGHEVTRDDCAHLPPLQTKQHKATQKQTSHMWEDFPYMGTLPMNGISSHTWEVSQNLGSLPQLWEVLPCMGSLPIYGKSSHTWEDTCLFTVLLGDLSGACLLLH
jgi:hypothetical protein